MRRVILVPYRSDNGGPRDELWDFTRRWLAKYHDEPVFVGASPEGPFNRGAAINDAARQAGHWDVALISDADNITDPRAVRNALHRAHQFGGCVFPFRTYLYLDEVSTTWLVERDSWFVQPIPQRWGIIREHCSGIQALSRVAYDKVGGFPELTGWGHEDMVMATMLKTFTPHVEHIGNAAYHLYHGNGHENPERQKYGELNRQILADVMSLSVAPEELRAYLRAGGHPIPEH